MLNPADDAFLAGLARRFPPGTLAQPQPHHLTEPRGRHLGRAGAVALPRTTEEVARLVSACAEARVGIVPIGGGTGLVGGQVMGEGPLPLLVSLERMSRVRGLFPSENVILVEAGAILADVQAAAEAAGRMFPLWLASEGSCRIGGNLACNAGGTAVLRYGNARDLCLGLEAVLPDGSVLHGLKRLRKDNTGYDLRNLLIGAEGTLGIITAASLKLVRPPAAEGAALLAVRDPAAALDLLGRAQRRLGPLVTGFELMHRQGLDFLAETMPGLRQPFAEPPVWTVLVDLGLAEGMDPAAELEALFAEGLEAGLVSDGIVAQSLAQRADFWAIRETIPEGNRRIGSIASHDISLPLGEIARFVEEAGAALARIGSLRVNCFGHLGDGNLHYNVFPAPGRRREDYEPLRAEITRCVHDLVHAAGGSISAEHGIGRLKVAELERYGDPARLAAMRAIKAALDPHGIMNPGAVLRAA
ncbi:FAD-binding oxidoreductase [Cereibacter azotoformans]|uniref:FAD-binding oxidoreductase n=1 Tax=Cereibacter azotoformans TaxID=43057 RepID=UPI001EEA08DC|nr:FAD-binding oxidoreductase [Cereibacter azotoformans]ULB08932.1 FAD-binding oxidoreductase [Cereibacter azotoformans]